MKLVTKNNYKFATGMFWQVPDEGKRSINLSKLVKDTRHNMMCQIKIINPTWGFCHKEEMQGEKKVASLGKFIIEASGLSANYANSIICYKFKNAGELDDDGRELANDLYGYIVLLNGTICPDEGEYVSNFEMVKESIIGQAKKYEIETLYLPLDVSASFFSIFENLTDSVNNDELLTKVMHNLTNSQKNDLTSLINNELTTNSEKYSQLMLEPLVLNLDLLKSLINEQVFEQKLKEQKEKNLRYLIPNVLTLSLTSDEIYWINNKFKSNYQSALIQSVSHKTTQKYKLLILAFLLVLFGYLAYKTFIYKEIQIQRSIPKPVVPRPVAVKPMQLINNCLSNNDRFFTDLGTWTLTKIKCDSLGATLSFDSDTDTTLSQFSKLIGKNDNNIKLTGKVGTYYIKYNIFSQPTIRNVTKEQILDQLQQAAINNSFKLSISQSMSQISNKNAPIKFNISAKQSPVYLFNQGILDNVKLNEINAAFDKSTGFYNWTLQGEF